MTSFADLITEWINAHPSRSAAALSRLTGVSRAEISLVLRGKRPSVRVAMKLGRVLPSVEVKQIIESAYPDLQRIFSG